MVLHIQNVRITRDRVANRDDQGFRIVICWSADGSLRPSSPLRVTVDFFGRGFARDVGSIGESLNIGEFLDGRVWRSWSSEESIYDGSERGSTGKLSSRGPHDRLSLGGWRSLSGSFESAEAG